MTIEGPDTAKVNETLNFKCETANSNPPATVQWVVDGRSMHATFSHSVRLLKDMKNVYPLALDYLGLLSRQAYTEKAKNVVQTFPFFCWKLSMHTCLAQKTFHTQFVIMLKMVKSNNLLFAYRQPVRMEAGLHPQS